MATDEVQLEGGGCGGVVGSSPAMAWGSAEYSWTSNTPQSKDAFSFFSLEAEGATLNKPWDTKSRNQLFSTATRVKLDQQFIWLSALDEIKQIFLCTIPPKPLSIVFNKHQISLITVE